MVSQSTQRRQAMMMRGSVLSVLLLICAKDATSFTASSFGRHTHFDCTVGRRRHHDTSNKRLGPNYVFNRRQEDGVAGGIRSSDDVRSKGEVKKSKIVPFFFQEPDEKTALLEVDTTKDKNINGYMGDLTAMLSRDDDKMSTSTIVNEEAKDDQKSLGQLIGSGALVTVLAIPFLLESLGISSSEIIQSIQNFFANPSASLQAVVETVESMGPLGAFYFGAVYTVAEILAIPAIPLTASAGYLFGVKEGTAIVLLSASIAAATSFLIGRTFLRSYVEKALEDYPEFQRIDKAIGKEGFKLMLLLRLSPIFPFALSNYLYGVTSVGFWPYFWGTMIGFTPGTIAYVYTGEVGKALTVESASSEPWYVYAGGLLGLTIFLKIMADVATGIIEDLEDEESMEGQN